MALWLGFFLHVHPLLLGVDARAGRGVVGGHQLLRGAEAPQRARGAGEAPGGLQGLVEMEGMESDWNWKNDGTSEISEVNRHIDIFYILMIIQK